MERSAASAANLTGVWQGLYTYLWGEEEGFVASVIHTGSTLTGSTHENETNGLATTDVLFALLDGRVEGAAVSFTKTYDGTGGWDHSVLYSGVVAADGSEIEGTWHIPGPYSSLEASGRFLMIRQTGAEEAVERVVEAVV